jgi:2-iminobutanoate/2-iminopropanoate deaminase
MSTKQIQGLDMPWEKDYQYAQGVKSGNTVWLAGQLGHDDKGILAEGMEAQVQLSYNNIQKLVATTIVAVSGLALPGQLIEIKIVARQ